MLQEMIDLLDVTNKNFLAEFGRMEAYLKALMQTPAVVALQNAEGNILFLDHDEEMVLVRDLEGMDALWIEGIRSNGQPIYSDVLEGTTNSWQDYPIDFIMASAHTLKTILEEKEISTYPSLPLDAEVIDRINQAVDARFPATAEWWNVGRTDDNRLTNKMQCGEMKMEGLPAGTKLMIRTSSPYGRGDRAMVQWALHYETPWN